MNAISVKKLTKYYGKSRGIIDVDLTVEKGDFFGFIGPNGAGKSTLIRTLLGLISKTGGEGTVLGQELGATELLSKVGYLPSELNFYRGMKASEIIDAFEEKQMLSSLVKETLTNSESRGIQVYIGEESPVSSIKDCSVVTATYELGEGMRGTIGIIGPKRMDYEKVVDSLKGLMHQLDNLYDKNE